MSKISLCIIVGNVEEYIDRCLSSFAPIADEIIVVRAIGNLVPDLTLTIAREKFGAKIGEYRNRPGHEDWPHVDDFAAARQLSFDLAAGDYCFWCDSDDILESGAEHVREQAERGGYACFIFPYKIFAKGITVPRERMIAREAGRWQFPVHECFKFRAEPIEGVEDQRVVVTHLPDMAKAGSPERNLRILESIPEAEMTTGLWFHLHQERALVGDITGSLEAAQRALACPDIGRPEKYEIYLNLAHKASEPPTKAGLLHQAYQADPRRREALGLLASLSLDYGRNEDAMAYARQMRATRPPAQQEWNERAAAYGWLGEDLYAQALRANGDWEQAEQVRRAAFKAAGGPRIALVHATRGRPQQAALARKLWMDFAERPDRVEHIFCLDENDQESIPLRRMHHIVCPEGGGCVGAWNAGASTISAPVMIQMSDDWVPPAQWDKLILERIGNPLLPRVLAVSDGARTDQLLCMAICTRVYYLVDHFLFHPWFTGVYSDNWFTELAYKRGDVIEARDLVFKHDHPFFSGQDLDATYQAQNTPERYAAGKAVLEALRQGKDFSTVHGWTNYLQFYAGIAEMLQDGDTVAEIGVWLGRSIIYLAQELQRRGKHQVKLIAVDTFRGEENQPAHVDIVRANGGNIRAAFEANIKRCGVADMIQIIEGDSADSASQVPDGSLAFCFIDAAHEYEPVKRDLAAWRPKVKQGGIFAGHDAHHEPVMRAVQEMLAPVQVLPPCWVNPI